jgi:hypothetical protein
MQATRVTVAMPSHGVASGGSAYHCPQSTGLRARPVAKSATCSSVQEFGGGRRTGLVVAVAATLSGCESRTPTEQALIAPAAAVAIDAGFRSDALPLIIRPEEQPFADLSRRVPSSAGFVVDSGGTLVVMIRDERDADAAIAVMSERVSDHDPTARFTSVRARRVAYSFGELARWRDSLSHHVFNRVAGVSSLDLDEATNRVTIGIVSVRFDDARAEIQTMLPLLGVPDAAVRFIIGEYGTLSAGTPTLAHREMPQLPPMVTDYFADLVGGISIMPSQAASGLTGVPCSIGFTANYSPPTGGSYLALVTATHCTSIWGAPDGTTFTQPDAATAVIGAEARDPNKWHCFWNWCRNSDAAVVAVTGRGVQVGLIVRTTAAASLWGVAGSRQIDQASPYFVITETGGIAVGEPYHKMGRTTGWTTGQKLLSCVDHSWTHPGAQGFWNLYVTKCGDVGSAYNEGGDSGGSVFARLDSNRVALLGTTVGRIGEDQNSWGHVYSPFSRIAQDVGGTLGVVRPPTLATAATSASVVSGYARVDWIPVVGATEYLVDLVDFIETCGDFGFGWECLMHGYPSSTVVYTPSFQDPRNSFTHVLQPWDPGYVRTHITITARNPLTGSFSQASATSRFARVDHGS